jgi:hypothetical protein
MVDRHPIEPRAEVLLHLSHHIPGEGPRVGKPVPVLRGDDESALMPILAATFCQRVTVCRVCLGSVQSAALAIAGGAVPLQVTDMGIGRSRQRENDASTGFAKRLESLLLHA